MQTKKRERLTQNWINTCFGDLPHRPSILYQRYTYYRVLQTIKMKLIFLCVVAEPAVLGSPKTDLKFKYEI